MPEPFFNTRNLRATLGSLLLCGSVFSITALAQSTAPPVVKSPRLYVFDCGVITNRDPTPYGVGDQHLIWHMAVPCFLVVHPRGTLLWDTGLGDSNLDTRPGRYTPGLRSLRDQLEELGYTRSEITYLAICPSPK
jgi:N-acyl homoserine lactone hydrolase